MAIRGVDFKWYDGFFLSMLATSIFFNDFVAVRIIVAINWKRYRLCTYPLHIWIVVDYTTVFVFRLLMFIDNGLAAGMGLDLGWQQRYGRFCGRVAVLSVLSLLLYPFLWAWTIIGTLWFTSARNCLPEEGQKWGFLIWLLFSYCGLLCVSCMSMGKWLTRRQAHLLRAQQGIPVSEYGVSLKGVQRCLGARFPTTALPGCALLPGDGTAWAGIPLLRPFTPCLKLRKNISRGSCYVNHIALCRDTGNCHVVISRSKIVLVDMVRVPDWAFEAAGQEMRVIGQDAASYHPGLYLTTAQREAVEALIQELPKFRLKAVPTDCSECPICLEEFHEGDEVRGLPCAHNFHIECIDEWLRLNVKCPRCRCSVFPNLDLSALSNLRTTDSERSSASVMTTAQYVRTLPSSQSYLLRMQGLLRPVRTENVGSSSGSDTDFALETAENGGAPVATQNPTSMHSFPSGERELVGHSTPPQH
ncbi:hypothetical protein EZV62_022817 [Acer yangbiense]|uniref:RING-type domain-containing protein n=1 Tax=Acer yangbiense TaxID=1000413 RepID=A0A5C7H048_9ROSI|nr:hypothetical protein EZV62_022817 [Acer yangbiense]